MDGLPPCTIAVTADEIGHVVAQLAADEQAALAATATHPDTLYAHLCYTSTANESWCDGACTSVLMECACRPEQLFSAYMTTLRIT